MSTASSISSRIRTACAATRCARRFIQKLPFARTRYRSYLPLFPLAIEQFDLSAYDVVLSSSYAVAKGVLSGPDQFHASYVHSPVRYAWDLQHQYLNEAGLARGQNRPSLARCCITSATGMRGRRTASIAWPPIRISSRAVSARPTGAMRP